MLRRNPGFERPPNRPRPCLFNGQAWEAARSMSASPEGQLHSDQASRILAIVCLAIFSQSTRGIWRSLIILCLSAAGTQSMNLMRSTDSLRAFSGVVAIPWQSDCLSWCIDLSAPAQDSSRSAKSSKRASQPASLSMVARHALTRDPAKVHQRKEDPSATSEVFPSAHPRIVLPHLFKPRVPSPRQLRRQSFFTNTDFTA